MLRTREIVEVSTHDIHSFSRTEYVLSENIGNRVFEKLKKDLKSIKQMSLRDQHRIRKSIVRSAPDVLEEVL